jgi:hypothetical protein
LAGQLVDFRVFDIERQAAIHAGPGRCGAEFRTPVCWAASLRSTRRAFRNPCAVGIGCLVRSLPLLFS